MRVARSVLVRQRHSVVMAIAQTWRIHRESIIPASTYIGPGGLPQGRGDTAEWPFAGFR